MRIHMICVVCSVGGLVAGAFAQHAVTSKSDEEGRKPKVVLTQELKEKIDGKEAQVVMLEMTYPPRGSGPKHRHPGPVFVYVIEGAIESQVEGEPLKTFKQGEAFFEPAGGIHLVSRNASKERPVKLLAVFLTEKGQKQLSMPVEDRRK